MNDLLPHQNESLIFAGQMAGEYLEEIGISDLARLSEDQYSQLLKIIVLNFLDHSSKTCPF